MSAICGCFKRNNVVDTEIAGKVGLGEELSKEDVKALESEGRIESQVSKENDIDRMKSFQKNLKLFDGSHNKEEVKIKFEHTLDVGVEASNAREFAERAGLHRGSITFDVTPQYRELKSYLDDPSCQPHLGKFMNRSFMQESLFCWIDINDYSLIPTSDYRRHMALQLIHKYIRPGAPMEVGFLEGETIEKYLKIEEKLKLGGEPDTSLFDKVSNACFREMVVNTLEPFKKSPEFEEWKKTHENSNLAVLINDFDYMAILGQGGFGRVVHVRKKTTGRHFAMKIQPKTALYDEHGGNLGDLHTEKTVFANCQHPFIVDMCYALQTKNHAILVLGLVDGGDLNDLLWRAEGGRLEESLARLYAAQIASALSHLHEIGIIFRDLKPENVLICGQAGNSKLTDMGLAAPIVVVEQREDFIESNPDNSVKNIEDIDGPNITPGNGEDEDKFGEDAAAANFDPETTTLSPREIDDLVDTLTNEGGGDKDTVASMEAASAVVRRASIGGMVQVGKVDVETTNQLLEKLEKKQRDAEKIKAQEEGKKTLADIDNAKKKIKRMSVVGTRGFMAPEIVEGKVLKRPNRRGYNESVDWFALGVTTYVMLTGGQPFSYEDPTTLDPDVVKNEFPRDKDGRIRRPSGFASLMQVVRFPKHMSHACCHFCKDLLHIHAGERLGSENGVKDIQQHDWMLRKSPKPAYEDLFLNGRQYPACELENLSFEKLMNNEYKVAKWVYNTDRSKQLAKMYTKTSPPKYKHYEHMMATFDARNQHSGVNWYANPKKKEQEVFESWDFMSYKALKDEMSVIDDDL